MIFCLSQGHGHGYICILRCFGYTDTDTLAFLSLLVLWLHWHISVPSNVGHSDRDISPLFIPLTTLTQIFLPLSVLSYTDTDVFVCINAFAALANEELHNSVLAVTHSQSLLAALILRTPADVATQLAVMGVFSILHLLPAGSLADDVRSQDFPYLNRFFFQQLRKVFICGTVPQAYILYIAVFWDVTFKQYWATCWFYCERRQQISPKRWYLSTRLHGVTSEKIAVSLATSIRIWRVTHTRMLHICYFGHATARVWGEIRTFFFGFAMGQNCYEDLDVNGKAKMTWILKQFVFMLLRTRSGDATFWTRQCTFRFQKRGFSWPATCLSAPFS